MRQAFIIFFPFLLVGCVSQPQHWEVNRPDKPVSYQPPNDLVERAPVREGRFPVDLPIVMKLAGANNLEIAFAREKVHEAYARSLLAGELFWPTLGLGYVFNRHEGLTQGTEGAFVDVDKENVFLGASARLQWEVGDAVFSTLSASQRYEGEQSRLEATRQSVILKASVAYYDLLSEQLGLKVAEQSVRISDKLTSELDVSVQAGRGFQGDVLRARVRLAGNRLRVLRSREAIELASIRLASILRLTPGIELYAAEELPAALSLVPSDASRNDFIRTALKRRPEIHRALAELEANRYDETGAKYGPLIPNIGVQTDSGVFGEGPSDTETRQDYRITLGWRIGPGGLFDSGRRHLARAHVKSAQINLERIRQKVTDEVLQSHVELRAKEKQRELAEQAVKDAEKALQLNQARQARNIGLPLELLQAEEALTSARMDFYTALIDYNQAQLRLFTAIGGKHQKPVGLKSSLTPYDGAEFQTRKSS